MVLSAMLVLGCTAPPENSARHWVGIDAIGTIDDPGEGGASGTGGAASGTAGASAPAGTGGTMINRPGTGGAAGGGQGGVGVPPPAASPVDSGQPPDSSMPPPPATPAGCLLDVTITTVSVNLDYAPRNIGAIWIADGAGKFIKTLGLWAGRRVRHLVQWDKVTTAAGTPRNSVDAVTSATANSHIAHKVKWDCTNTAKATVNQGAYQLCMEMTESNVELGDTLQTACVPFTHASTPFELAPPDVKAFKARRLVYTPK
jgi:hypothetical protein